MYGLNIHLDSFELNPNIIKANDKIRVSITSLPEESKEAFIIEAKNMNYVHHFFTVNITPETRKIIFVFRKKSFLQGDPIIASTSIHADQFPTPNNMNNINNINNMNNTEMKKVNIFEPIQNNNNININKLGTMKENRRIYGEMRIQLSTSETFPTSSFKTNFGIEKIHKGEGYSKVTMLSSHENQNQNNSIFYNCDF